jgi:hypothetical protein
MAHTQHKAGVKRISSSIKEPNQKSPGSDR